MKKLVIAAILILSSSFLAASPAFGYSLAPVGVVTPSGSYGGLSISAIFAPYDEAHAGDIAVTVDLSPVKPFFEGVSMTFSSPVFRLLRHPFSWVFTNSVLWAPVFTAGVQYRLGNEWNMIVGFAPLAFQDTHFVYEFFSPFAIYSIEADEWGWGCYILRFSYFF